MFGHVGAPLCLLLLQAIDRLEYAIPPELAEALLSTVTQRVAFAPAIRRVAASTPPQTFGSEGRRQSHSCLGACEASGGSSESDFRCKSAAQYCDIPGPTKSHTLSRFPVEIARIVRHFLFHRTALLNANTGWP
jgi:hypothetical protein